MRFIVSPEENAARLGVPKTDSGDGGRAPRLRRRRAALRRRGRGAMAERFAERKQLGRDLRRADGAEHRAEQVVQVAQLSGFLRRRGRIRAVPQVVRQRGLLPEQYRADEEDARGYLARHSSRPAMNRSFGSFLPMNTITDCFFSALPQGLPTSPPIIMCTPWNTTRSFLPFIHSTPL